MTREQWLAWLRPGDVILYADKSLIGVVIRWKTWSDVSHVEVYLGDGYSAAARARGVNTYPFDDRAIRLVLRPNVPFDIARMRAFHESCVGQKYDYWGLIRVFVLNKQGAQDRAYCSEHAARMAKRDHGGPGMINARADCDEVSPGQCPLSPNYDWWLPAEVEAALGGA